MKVLEIDKDWQVYNQISVKVDYCLSGGVEHREADCAIRYSSVLLLVVTGLNGCVLTCVYFAWNIHRAQMKEVAKGRWEEEQLTTVDEAVSSFLQHEDQYTMTATFLECSDYDDSIGFCTPAAVVESRAAADRLRSNLRWYRGAGRVLWYTTTFVFVGAAAAITFLVVKAVGALTDYGIPTDLASLWRMGVGETHGYTIALTKAIASLGANAFYGTLFLANVPQVVLGVGWWLANSLLTRLLLAQRWAKFIVKRSGLRVPSPQGQQRRSFFLSLPYRYSIPLLILSAVLHWLLSQSFFVVQTRGFVYDMAYQDKDQFVRDEALDASVIGYSTIAFILSLAIVFGIFIGIVLLAMKPLPSREIGPCEGGTETDGNLLVTRMPLVSTCSAAISAACHPGPGSCDAHLKPVQWGKTRSGRWSITDETSLQYSLGE
ncbi:hypothetical protein SAMD00023353_1301040 [Rosellinia necatrix]|uniref:Uncharacterized protein n=1 Tax=Rosellinia necatrix TaxID=77044 RepID=A0A1W2TCF3_ROSNE|nr:hypothetical protein SAMD00023353_1301040 [Rosellinia necatrix]